MLGVCWGGGGGGGRFCGILDPNFLQLCFMYVGCLHKKSNRNVTIYLHIKSDLHIDFFEKKCSTCSIIFDLATEVLLKYI